MKRRLEQRPDQFTLNPENFLANGLVAAYLSPGYLAKSTLCYDSSLYQHDGTLTNMEPDTDWLWDSILNRWCLNFGGTNEFVTGIPPITAVPITMACWAYVSADGASQDLIALSTAADDNAFRLNAGMATANDPVRAIHYGSSVTISTVGTISLNTWLHTAATFVSSSERYAWLNGVSGSNTVGTKTPAGIDQLNLGSSKASVNPLTGRIADALIWNRVLSASEIKQLADPSNVMLSGLILPPRRRLWAVPAAAPSGTKYWLWAREQKSQVIGGGL